MAFWNMLITLNNYIRDIVYLPNKLRELAEGYRDVELLIFVEKYLEESNEPDK